MFWRFCVAKQVKSRGYVHAEGPLFEAFYQELLES